MLAATKRVAAMLSLNLVPALDPRAKRPSRCPVMIASGSYFARDVGLAATKRAMPVRAVRLLPGTGGLDGLAWVRAPL